MERPRPSTTNTLVHEKNIYAVHMRAKCVHTIKFEFNGTQVVLILCPPRCERMKILVESHRAAMLLLSAVLPAADTAVVQQQNSSY